MKGYTISNNPYTLRFSYIPPRMIERTVIMDEIIGNFVRDIPTYSGMFITGVRGAGKTVMLSEIRKRMGAGKDWITVDLNPESDLLDSLARRLFIIPELKRLFLEARLDFSVLGIGIHLESAELIASNEEDAVLMMLRALKKAGKKLFVTIDEVTYSKKVARFSHALSSYSSEGYDIYVLMTGLIENINNIRNKKSLTFLYRAKVKELDILNISLIRNDYQDALGLPFDLAEHIARESRGYSLAFQAIGHLYYDEICRCDSYDKIDQNKINNELDQILSELSYDKIWSELSDNDRAVLKAMSEIKDLTGKEYIKIEQIRNTTGMSSDSFTKYRSRLLERGIVDGSQYGHLRFKLPRFEQYISREG